VRSTWLRKGISNLPKRSKRQKTELMDRFIKTYYHNPSLKFKLNLLNLDYYPQMLAKILALL